MNQKLLLKIWFGFTIVLIIAAVYLYMSRTIVVTTPDVIAQTTDQAVVRKLDSLMRISVEESVMMKQLAKEQEKLNQEYKKLQNEEQSIKKTLDSIVVVDGDAATLLRKLSRVAETPRPE